MDSTRAESLRAAIGAEYVQRGAPEYWDFEIYHVEPARHLCGMPAAPAQEWLAVFFYDNESGGISAPTYRRAAVPDGPFLDTPDSPPPAFADRVARAIRELERLTRAAPVQERAQGMGEAAG